MLIDDVLALVMQGLDPLTVAIVFQRVCRQYRNVVLHEKDYWLSVHEKLWRHPLYYDDPHVPLHLYVAARWYAERVALPILWTVPFRQSLTYGKYSRWAVDRSCTMMQTMAWAIRMIGSFPTECYCHKSVKPYNPRASTSANVGDGWNMVDNGPGFYKLRHESSFGLVLLSIAMSLNEPHSPYDVIDENIAMALQQSPPEPRVTDKWDRYAGEEEITHEPELPSWSPASTSPAFAALDAMKYVRLLRVLSSSPEVMRGVLWDCDSICCRGISALATDASAVAHFLRPEFKCLIKWVSPGGRGGPNPRQVPPTYNLYRLCEFAEVRREPWAKLDYFKE